jgi:hypothetical protein
LFFRTEVHLLAFHIGQPIDTLLEWENLDFWAARPETFYVVMPSRYADEWRQHLHAGALVEVMRSDVLAGAEHDDPLMLFRTQPVANARPTLTRTDHASAAGPAADRTLRHHPYLAGTQW